jgi:cytochrome c2
MQREMAMGSNGQKTANFIPAAVLMMILLAPGELAAQSSSQDASMFIGDATIGEKIFKKCRACHKLGVGAKNSTGPVLTNVVGRAAGSFKGFNYGKGMLAAGKKGLVWNAEQLFNYIADPKKYLRKYLGEKKARAKMKFKLKKEDDRKNVIAYLQRFSDQADAANPMAKVEETSKIESVADIVLHEAAENQICIQNNFPKKLLLVAEAKNGRREVKTVNLAGVLCVGAEKDGNGSVGVFENEDAFEGCSRLARAGKTQVLITYASFDNCKWMD